MALFEITLHRLMGRKHPYVVRFLADFGMSAYRSVRGDSRRSSLGQATRSWADIAACRPSTIYCRSDPENEFRFADVQIGFPWCRWARNQ